MKSIIKYLFILFAVTGIAVSCDKVDDLPFYGEGEAPVLTASTTTVAPLPEDSLDVVLTLNWTYPGHGTDTSNIKYTIEIDSAGKNFANPFRTVVMGEQNYSFVARELNSALLARGYAFNVPVGMDVRVISSYANNNERLPSNSIKIMMTPYKIPPKVALPSSNRLFIVGGATQGGWNNPVPVPVQELTRMNETTWSGIFTLNGNQSYLLLPVNGSWDNKYGGVSSSNNSNNPLGDEFKFSGSDLIAPATTGNYRVDFDFQIGRFTLTPVANALPGELYITGDATTGGWTNSPPAAQKFTQLTNGVFELTINLEPGKFYKFLSSHGNWQPQFGGNSATGGTLGANYGSGGDPDAVPTPAQAGNYKITVNFLTNTYTVTPA